MDAAISFLGLTIYPYGLYVTAGILLLLGAMGILGYLHRLPAGTVRIFGLLAMPLGVLCSRLVYCALNFAAFTETYQNPWLMLNFFDGGLSMTGLLCGLVLAAWLTSRIKDVRFGNVADVLAAGLGLLIAALCAGQGHTELGVGKVVEEGAWTANLPWLFLSQRMGVNVEYRMAVYRYEAIAGLLLFAAALILLLLNRKPKAMRPGDLAMVVFSLYGAMQTLLESLRDDGHLLITFLRAAQLAAALMPLLAAGIFTVRYHHLQPGRNRRLVFTWAVLLLCVAGITALEFSLDGRLTWGTPSMGRDYAIMAVLCALLAAMPCSLCYTLNRRLYQQERFCVHVRE